MALSRRRLLLVGTGLAGGLAVGACTAPQEPAPPQTTPPHETLPGGGPTPSATRSAGPPTSAAPTSPPASNSPPSSPRPPSAALPKVRDRRSLPALMRRRFGSERPDRGAVLARTSRYTTYAVRYPSGSLTISGVLWVPRRSGRSPAIVLNHGYIDPSRYVSGQGMPREQEFLASRGFVVLHTDYRGHARSSRASALDRELRLGYAEDSINAAYALKAIPEVDDDKVAMFGRSMGGGVTYNALVSAPGAVRCAITWASVSSSFTDNYDRWTRPQRRGTADALVREWGEPDDDKPFYADLCSRNFFDRITEPVLVEHGTADRTCPPRWSERTVGLLKEADVDVTVHRRRGEDHTYYSRWREAMDDTYAFLRRHLDL